jgi:hypothetical protein
MGRTRLISRHDGFQRTAWIVALIAASALLTCSWACATPFAALAALGALNMTRRDAFIAVMGVWLVNQALGFSILAYPTDGLTFAWGAAIAVAALLALVAASVAATGLRRTSLIVQAGAAFLAAFAAYEAGLYAATFALGGAEAAFSQPFVAQIFKVDVISFVALLALHRAALAIGLAAPAPRSLAPA